MRNLLPGIKFGTYFILFVFYILFLNSRSSYSQIITSSQKPSFHFLSSFQLVKYSNILNNSYITNEDFEK